MDEFMNMFSMFVAIILSFTLLNLSGYIEMVPSKSIDNCQNAIFDLEKEVKELKIQNENLGRLSSEEKQLKMKIDLIVWISFLVFALCLIGFYIFCHVEIKDCFNSKKEEKSKE